MTGIPVPPGPVAPSGPDLADLDAARVRAIDDTGWGAGVRVFQPRNLALWLWAALVVWGAVLQVQRWTASAGYYAPALSLALVAFALYGAVFWWFTQHIDRYAAQPVTFRLMAFLWGALAATWVFSAPANDAIRSLLAKAFGTTFALEWGPGIVAPIDEEWSKGLGLLLLIAIAPHLVRTAFDGFILGAFIGLGFQILEDIAYVLDSAPTQFGANQIGASMQTFVVRMASGIGSHILFSAIFCTGLVLAIGRPQQPRRLGTGIGLIALAMALHGIWDAQGPLLHAALGDSDLLPFAQLALMVLLPLIGIAIVIRVFHLAVAGEREFVRPLLAPELARGVVTAAEVDAAAGDRKARKKYRAHGRGLGHGRRNRHVLEAVFDLADELGRARGADTARVHFARAEVARLRRRTDEPHDDGGPDPRP
ncbi:PrsW family intramembrane metalloprotease [Jiangella alba]|uniref:Protease prsW family protein n=1 Tax=Jiangella alba TaxID=561176 RepID=A0A1H5JDC8_9ACTN|nr:PrsW family intramembrane metalloprotease [Jiangella alba]SEE50565.1 Protease prsW family protein [Jiangella alba]